MKKFLVLLLILFTPSYSYSVSYMDRQLREVKHNAKYNTTQKQLGEVNYITKFSKTTDISSIKDPKLIKLIDIEPINDKDYAKKIAKDNQVYEKEIYPTIKQKTNTLNIEPRAIDFYKVYRIAERIIRANNLQYTNWRIAIKKTPEDFNAYSTAGNLIIINTALYDSLYTNEDALAYIIGHEIAHSLLGHQQRSVEMQRIFASLKSGARTRMDTRSTLQASVKLATNASAAIYKTHMYRDLRTMEYMADAEGLNLITKAGYSSEEAESAIRFMMSMVELNQLLFRSHPMAIDRIKAAQENAYFANPQWIEEGKYNIYNSNVLTCKKSSDNVSIVIEKDENIKRHYHPETLQEKLTRLAYVSYTKGDMNNAVKYFEKLSNVSNDYTTYLYLSYAYEYLYAQTKDKSYINKSKTAIKKAAELNKNDKYVQEQISDIVNL